MDIPTDSHTIFDGQCLTVIGTGSRYLLAMKLVSGWAVDEDDCEYLIRERGIAHEENLYGLISAVSSVADG